MSKRRATEQLQPAVSGKRHEAIPGDRARLFKSRLTSLNQQFASWVSTQAETSANQLWLDGVQQYQDYVRALLEEFKDLVGDEAQLPGRQRDAAPSPGGGIFSTPVAGAAAAAGSNSRDQSAAPLTGGSTGRKSVTWADSHTAVTPAHDPAAANGTPNHNTTNAGHTPAPANLGRGGYSTPTPAFKLHDVAESSPAAAAAAAGKPSAHGQSSMMFAASRETPAAEQGAAAEKTPGSAGGFTFGGSGFGTPISAAADAGKTAKAGGSNSSSPLFAFGTPAATPVASFAAPAAANNTATDKTAAAAPGPSTFSFGTPAPANSGAGTASKGDTPTFGLAAGNSSDKAKAQAADMPTLSFGVPQGSGLQAAGSSPGFTVGTPSTTAGSSDAAAGSTQAAAFSFGVSSSAAASSSGPVCSLAAAGSSGRAGGGGGGGGGTGGGSTSGGFSFGAGSSSAAGAGGSSAPPFAFGSPAAAMGAGGNSNASNAPGSDLSNPGPAPAFGAASFAFGSLPAANGAPASMFKFPAPAAAAGGGVAGAAAAAGGAGVDEDGDDAAEAQEEKTEVQADTRWTVLKSMKVILYLLEPQEGGSHKWTNKGKCTLSFRRLKEGSDSHKVYVIVTSDGQGKQLVCHALGASDRCEPAQGKADRIAVRLVNTLYSVKKGEGAMPETVVQHKMRSNIIKFASEDAATQFTQLLTEYKPKAAA